MWMKTAMRTLSNDRHATRGCQSENAMGSVNKKKEITNDDYEWQANLTTRALIITEGNVVFTLYYLLVP